MQKRYSKNNSEKGQQTDMKKSFIVILCAALTLLSTSASSKTLVEYYSEQHAVQLGKVTDEEFASPITYENMIVRIAEIEVHPQYLKEYLEYANEVDRLSVEREPGVICLFPMQSAEDSTKIRILEIYASEEAYQSHLKTDHFLKYKQGTLHMVKDLKLPSMKPLDPETMKKIFKKQR